MSAERPRSHILTRTVRGKRREFNGDYRKIRALRNADVRVNGNVETVIADQSKIQVSGTIQEAICSRHGHIISNGIIVSSRINGFGRINGKNIDFTWLPRETL